MSKPTHRIVVALVAGLLLALPDCGQKAPPPAKRELTIAFVSANRGEIEPCG